VAQVYGSYLKSTKKIQKHQRNPVLNLLMLPYVARVSASKASKGPKVSTKVETFCATPRKSLQSYIYYN